MDYRIAMNYLSSKASVAIGTVFGLPPAVIAAVKGENVTLTMGIALGVLAFLWAVRKYPLDQMLKDAKEVFQENLRLRRQNSTLAEENERLRVKLAYLEEDSKLSGHDRPTLP